MTNTGPSDQLSRLSEEELTAAGIARGDLRAAYTTGCDPGIFDVSIADDAEMPSADSIHAYELVDLPRLLRAASDLEATRRQAWWIAYQNYRQCLARSTMYYHEIDRLQITAAQIKAETDPDVINPMVESRRLWEAWQTARRARVNLKLELRVRSAMSVANWPTLPK